MRIINCEMCGDEVFASGPRQKYCPACAKKRIRENARDQRNRIRRGQHGMMRTSSGGYLPVREIHDRWGNPRICLYCGETVKHAFDDARLCYTHDKARDVMSHGEGMSGLRMGE